jgi:hypothetical protein
MNQVEREERAMSVRVEVAPGTGVAGARRTRSRRLRPGLRRAWVWLVLKQVDDPGAEHREYLERTMRLAPLHWR